MIKEIIHNDTSVINKTSLFYESNPILEEGLMKPHEINGSMYSLTEYNTKHEKVLQT